MDDGTPRRAADDEVFKALADPTRRALLDRLRIRNGRSLTELGENVGMARQSLTQHVDQLVAAGLVTVVRHGRQRLHFLNPEPIHRLQERWIDAFDRPRLDALADIRHRAEEHPMNDTTARVADYHYVTYIRAGIAEVWRALTDADLTAQYWSHRNESTWREGDEWRHLTLDAAPRVDCIGRVLRSDQPHELQITFESPDEYPSASPSIVTFRLVEGDGITQLSVTHERLATDEQLANISHGWSSVLSNLKSLLETGSALPQEPWRMAPPTSA